MLLLYGCASQTNYPKTQPPVTATPLQTLDLLNTGTPSKLATSSPETSFSVTESCPSDRYVLDKYSGFSSDANLVGLIDNKLILTNISTGATDIYGEIVIDRKPLLSSTDGKHIAYMTMNGSEKTLWVFTPSIRSSPKSYPIPSETVSISWIASDKIALWNYPDTYGCQQYSGFFDLNTEVITQPANKIPELDPTRCRLLPSISENGLKALYPWQVQDLNTGAISEIHLVDNVATDPPRYFLDWANGSISILSFKENLLSYLLDLTTSSLNDQPIKLHTVQLPAFATKDYYWTLPIIGSNIKRFGWDLIDPNADVPSYDVDPGKGNLPTNFYGINLDINQFTNYCLDRSVPFDLGKVNFAKPVQQGYFSPDGKYLAWTIYSNADYTPPIETQVLDLETGVVIVIKDLETFGWVIQ